MLKLHSKHPVVTAVVFLIIASFLHASTGVLIRLLSYNVSVEVVVFYRNLIGLALFLLVIFHQRLRFFATRHLWLHGVRACIGLSAMYAFFYAIARFSLAEAMLFVYAAPVFVPLFAFVILSERISLSHLIIALVGLCGIALVFGVSEQVLVMAPIGLACTFLSSTAFVVVRKLSFTEPAERVVFYFSLFGTLIASVPVFLMPQWRFTAHPDTVLLQSEFTLYHWGLLFAVGVLTTVAQWFISRAYSYAPAGQVAPASYLTVVFAGVYGYGVWGELPSLLALFGYLVVFVAVLFTVSMAWFGRTVKDLVE